MGRERRGGEGKGWRRMTVLQSGQFGGGFIMPLSTGVLTQ